MRFLCKSHFPYGSSKGNTSTREDFKSRTRGRLGTTREGSKTTREAAGVPSSFMAVRVLLKTWLEELEDARGLRAEAFKTTRTWLIQLQSTRGLVVRASLGPHYSWAQALYRRLVWDYSTDGPRYSQVARTTQTTLWIMHKTACTTRTTPGGVL